MKNLLPRQIKKQYTMIDINDLVNKLDEKSISRNEAINIYNDIAEKGKKIAELRQTSNRQKFLDTINSLKKLLMNYQTLQTCLIQKVKDLQQKEEKQGTRIKNIRDKGQGLKIVDYQFLQPS